MSNFGLPLLVVHTSQVAMNNGMVRTEAECTQVGSYSSVKDPSFLQDISQIDIGIQECGVQLNCLKTQLTLSICAN